jgi:putative DNA primase/helicase
MMRPHILELFNNVKPNGANRYLASCPTDAHKHGDRHPSLSITVLPDGTKLLHCFAGCSPEDICHEIGLELKDLFAKDVSHGHRPIYKPQGPKPDEKHQKKLENNWSHYRPLNGSDVASVYLHARGLRLKSYPKTLRWASKLGYYNNDWVKTGEHPAMVALVEHPSYGLVSLHRTYLTDDGTGKAKVDKDESPKKFSKAVCKSNGAAVKLFQPSDLLALAEGIETALAVHQATGWPVWACCTAVLLEHVLIPDSVRDVVICADADVAGTNAANTLAERLLEEGKEVRLAVPPQLPALKKTDWLDVLNHEAVAV